MAHTTITFARIITTARQHAGMTAAEMDYSLSHSGEAIGHLRSAAWALANPDWAQPSAKTQEQCQAAADALWAAVNGDTELAGMIQRAKQQSYTGWSDAARAMGQRIRYATREA